MALSRPRSPLKAVSAKLFPPLFVFYVAKKILAIVEDTSYLLAQRRGHLCSRRKENPAPSARPTPSRLEFCEPCGYGIHCNRIFCRPWPAPCSNSDGGALGVSGSGPVPSMCGLTPPVAAQTAISRSRLRMRSWRRLQSIFFGFVIQKRGQTGLRLVVVSPID